MISTEKPEKFTRVNNSEHLIGQVKKSTGRMPWHWEPMKDVTSCDKLRAGANIR